MQKYHDTTSHIARLVTRKYSTSFYWASLFFRKEVRRAIFDIYGFVRFADEIVDTFHDYNREELLNRFSDDLYLALEQGISLNPVLHAFARTVRRYDIAQKHIDAFLRSMRYDLTKGRYTTNEAMDDYINGSAEVVGLMCLKVFCADNPEQYQRLEKPAIRLGAAFQKVNFLRDIGDDMGRLDRRYFPQVQETLFDNDARDAIVSDIEEDFRAARKGIVQLPRGARLAVTIAWLYYLTLLRKLKKMPAELILTQRIRTQNYVKVLLVFKALIINITKKEQKSTNLHT